MNQNYKRSKTTVYLIKNPIVLAGEVSKIGKKVFWLKYTSANDWRSNCGNVDIEVLTEEKEGYHPKIKEPLFAVDFVYNTKEFIAVDLNVSPGLKGTGIENILLGKEVAALIIEAIEHFKDF